MTNTNLTTVQQPIDYEALPLPFNHAPQIIQTLVKQEPDCWQQTSTLALLPALSVACGNISYGADKKPLAFHVAVYGMAGSGKSQFTCRPAQFVQDYLSRNDNGYRKNGTAAPRIIGFEISTVQLCKYLALSQHDTVMLYTDEISQAIGSERSSNSFMQLQPILRKGFDGITHTMDYKEKDSFRGTIKPRLSFLACGTPNSLFRYFNDKAIEEGTTRRVIFVEHPEYEPTVPDIAYTDEQTEQIHEELNWLEMQSGMVYHEEIEKAVLAWKTHKLAQMGTDKVKRLMINTPTDIYRRAAYLAYVLNHFERVEDSLIFGQWVAEYMLRATFNHTFAQQQTIADEGKKHFAVSTQAYCEDFNQTMLDALPQQFEWQDVVTYRKLNNYSGAHKSRVILTRWKSRGKIKQIKSNTFIKL